MPGKAQNENQKGCIAICVKRFMTLNVQTLDKTNSSNHAINKN